jgi:hypothetical protein
MDAGLPRGAHPHPQAVAPATNNGRLAPEKAAGIRLREAPVSTPIMSPIRTLAVAATDDGRRAPERAAGVARER